MSENQPEPIVPAEPTVEPANAMVPVATAPQSAEASLSEEFRVFGKNLTALLHALRESRQAKEIETEVTQAFRDVEHQFTEAMNTAQQRLKEQNLKDTLVGAAQTASDETARGLAKGLRMVNERMAKMVQETENASLPKPRSGHIEIESVEPAEPSTPPVPPGESQGETTT